MDTGVSGGRIVLPGCRAAGAGVGDATGAAGGVDVTATVTNCGPPPQAGIIIARLINTASVGLNLSIVRLDASWRTGPLANHLLVQLRCACRVGKAIVAVEGPVESLYEGLAVGCAAEPVVAVGYLPGLK